eukprot:CAMPEP_0202347820 /NCGR_PEP_ID=MMETSP1126-20121109/6019_1 /ASSEMBLY_ACC=CAM_ASM_000457 /TAXON_ID=3047 /ORGANISM="Dunaliella tertiolecta, Strain CCMP1320" /LENGTH=85 /DNA_ID=CAMNT_0048939427 /DNA_START=1374 /DNA_END=1631 /DNA_ORIENTATION=+
MHESALFRDVFHSPFLARGVSKMGSALLGTCTHCGLVTERAAASAPLVATAKACAESSAGPCGESFLEPGAEPSSGPCVEPSSGP